MWAFLSGGFVSIVAHRDQPDHLMVRARQAAHLRRLWPDAQVWLTPEADYPARAVLLREEVADVLAEEALSMQYPNFKASIADDAYHRLCSDLWHVHHMWGSRQEQMVPDASPYLLCFDGTSEDAVRQAEAYVREKVDKASPKERRSENLRMVIGEGSLTLCDLLDFQETLSEDHTVVTLCHGPPAFPKDAPLVPWLHRYFRAHDTRDEPWLCAIEEVRSLIDEGRHVLLHCVYGRDRTGVVAYGVLRSFGWSHHEAKSTLQAHRPRMARTWATRLEEAKARDLGDLVAS